MKNKMVQYGLMACLLSIVILIDAYGDGGLPKISPANRETIRIMKTIKIPPPYTPVYQPMTWQQYVPSVGVTPGYSPKVGSVVQPLSIPKSATIEPYVLPVAVTNTTSASVTNISVADKAVKTPASTATIEKEKALNLEKK